MKIFFVLAAAVLIASSCCAAFAQDAAREPRYARGEAVVLLRVPEEIRASDDRRALFAAYCAKAALHDNAMSAAAARTKNIFIALYLARFLSAQPNSQRAGSANNAAAPKPAEHPPPPPDDARAGAAYFTTAVGSIIFPSPLSRS